MKLYYTDTSLWREDSSLRYCYEQLSEFRRKKADAFRHPQDRALCIAAGILLDAGLKEYGMKEADMRYAVSEFGKPYFADEPDIRFSISHSGTKALVCFADGETGCDLEQIRDVELKIAKRFFHEKEYADILQAESEQEKRERFFRFWTIKESCLKAAGVGLYVPMNSFEVRLDRGEDAVTQLLGRDYFYREPELFPGYRSAVSSPAPIGELQCLYVQPDGTYED